MAYGVLQDSVTTDNGDDANLIYRFTAPLTILSNQPSFVQDSMNLKRSASEQGVQRWELTTGIEATNNSSAFMVHSVIKGYTKIFNIRMPQVAGLVLSGAAGVSTTSAANANTSQIAITFTEPLVAGEFIGFGSTDTKVYMVVSGNNGIMTISPPLRRFLAANTPVYFGNVKLKARYSADVQIGITYTDGLLSDPGSINFVEAL